MQTKCFLSKSKSSKKFHTFENKTWRVHIKSMKWFASSDFMRQEDQKTRNPNTVKFLSEKITHKKKKKKEKPNIKIIIFSVPMRPRPIWIFVIENRSGMQGTLSEIGGRTQLCGSKVVLYHPGLRQARFCDSWFDVKNDVYKKPHLHLE